MFAVLCDKRSEIMSRRFTSEFKVEASRLVERVGVMEASRQLDAPDSSIGNWVRRDRRGGFKMRPVPPPEGSPEQLRAELLHLRHENARLQSDNVLLKKWAAYFARESS